MILRDNWIEYGKTVKDFMHDGLFKTGTLLEIKSNGIVKERSSGIITPRDTGKRTYEIVIGNVNELGGMCSCCDISSDKVILRYKLIWKPNNEDEELLMYEK
jgi:hypothetical protein